MKTYFQKLDYRMASRTMNMRAHKSSTVAMRALTLRYRGAEAMIGMKHCDAFGVKPYHVIDELWRLADGIKVYLERGHYTV